MNISLKKIILGSLAISFLMGICIGFAQQKQSNNEFKKVGHPLMESPHFNPIAINGDLVYVTNTPSGTVDVVDGKTEQILERIHVGVDPVSIAVRPDGKEVWVSNHVSDSVSVIDTDKNSPTYHLVIATIQEFDDKKATLFDEPVGIAFANNEKAYVALSSENQIAVVDVKTRKVNKRLSIRAQEPRGIVVNGNKLYVIPFESGNQTQISGGKKENIDGKLVTFDAWQHVVTNNNVLSLGYVADIVKHPFQPDYDLFVFDTKTDRQIEVTESLGTLLYGIATDSNGQVFIAQTDARNHINGRAGTKKHGLAELENRPYLNQISIRKSNGDKKIIDLEPLPPNQSTKEETLATPYALKVSDDNSFLIASAAASDKIFILDIKTEKILGQIKVGAGPRGIALEKGAKKAWIYNALDNSVSVLGIDDPQNIRSIKTIGLEDPTDPIAKRGRIYFNSASVSSTGTFSCASCHPDGHTDQLIWVLDTPIVSGGKQIMPRLTMPIRGLRDTEPFHWDGTKGDPYGGINSANLTFGSKPNCKMNDPIGCMRQLIDDNIATTMSLPNKVNKNNLTDFERNAMATYLLSVPYPAAPKRAYDDSLTKDALRGFELFHVLGDDDPKEKVPNVCGNCHRMPFLVSARTFEPRIGMKATTWRGASDRFQITPQARGNVIDFPWVQEMARNGRDEKAMWRTSWSGDSGPRTRFDPVWNMVLEMSTGFSGAFGRQLTIPLPKIDTSTSELNHEQKKLNELAKDYVATDLMTAMNNSFNTTKLAVDYTYDLIKSLESAHSQGFIVLEVKGVYIEKNAKKNAELQYKSDPKGWLYIDKTDPQKSFNFDELMRLASEGKFVGTFTAKHGISSDMFKHPQPAIWSQGKIDDQRKQDFPSIRAAQKSFTISGRHIRQDDSLIVDGKKVDGAIILKDGEKITVTFNALPTTGVHLMQIQEKNGLLSNEFIFYVR